MEAEAAQVCTCMCLRASMAWPCVHTCVRVDDAVLQEASQFFLQRATGSQPPRPADADLASSTEPSVPSTATATGISISSW